MTNCDSFYIFAEKRKNGKHETKENYPKVSAERDFF